ncbi:pitrilysin family protein [Marinicella sp. S1101]|uniref:M16 family metallopeptidase n=1 Tax=Marinicella marina TaxID=2996016 RepID=UPI0022608B9E|nr:pitrilysin family protein [Marinicella marina]MCX7555135.1 pitrilysin family protein [Marinicella marina]MDJ1140344.1 pitrilysin family protein [Marinicella marina]
MRFKNAVRCLTAMLVMSLSFNALAKLPKGIEKVTEVEGITEYRMDNGLQILLFPDQSQETQTVNITYHVGSKHENYGETGMAHLLEHLVFKGTPTHPNITKELTDRGAEPNGTTWTDRTNYFETLAASDDNLEWAIGLEADRMINSFISKEDLDSEMTVVRNELENGDNNPIRVLLQRMGSIAYDWHNYGKSTIGARADLENVDISNLQAFYRKYYQPDNATLIVAGKIDVDKTLALIDKHFGPIPKPERVLPELYTEEPIQDGERSVTVRRAGDVQVVGVMYKAPAGSDEMFPAVNVLSQVMAHPTTGRLNEKVVKKGLAAGSFGFNFQWAEPGVMNYMIQVAKDKDLMAAKDAFLETLENVDENPVTEAEVKAAKANLIKQFELSFNSSEGIALALSEWVGMGDWRLMFRNRDLTEAVTVEQVQQAAEEYMVNDNRTLGLFIPETDFDRADSIKRYSVAEVKAKVADYQGREAVAQGEDFDPSFENIDARTKRVELPNNAELVHVNKETRGDSVVMNMRLDLGNEEALYNKSTLGLLAARMLDRGTENLNRNELKAKFDELKANVGVSGSATGANISVRTTRENLPAVIELLDEVLKKPAFDAEELEVLKQEIIVGLEQQKQQPTTQVFRTLGQHLDPYEPGHPRYQMDIDDQIAEIKAAKLKDIKAFHKKFYGGQDADISIVGDFDEDVVTAEVESVLKGWESDVEYQRVPASYAVVDSINRFIDTPDKSGAAFGAMMRMPISDDHPDYPALFMANQMFGGGFISSRLANRLRQQDGLSYGAGSFFNASSQDEVATFGAYAICAPENLVRVEQGFKEELQKVLDEGFTQQELDDARNGVLQNNRIDRAKDNRLASQLASYIDLDRTQEWNKNYEQAIQDLTILQVNMAFNKYVDMDSFSIITAGDAAKAKGE